MKTNRKLWNENQGEFRRVLTSFKQPGQAIQLFLRQHGRLHSQKIGSGVDWSYEDEILDGMSENMWRRILPNEEHSIVWCIWHLARIEDVTMNILVAGRPQLLPEWLPQLKTSFRDTGNANDVDETLRLSSEIDLTALRSYRQAVGVRTREIACQLTGDDVKHKVSPARIKQIAEQGAVRPSAVEILDYWENLTIAGLLLMPPTRHNFIHLNEVARLKAKR